ncbi:MAG: hypothetical protein GY940_03265, partial [bacterium]|nr:hypothetical protein [bacterium]
MMKRELGTFERAMVFANGYFPFNAVVALKMSNGPAEDILKQALHYLQQRHPMLGVHLHKEKKHWSLVSEGTPAIPLETVTRKDENQWESIVEDELNSHIDALTGPLIRVTYLAAGDNGAACELVVTFLHVIMDATSGTNILHEILSICHAINTGNTGKTGEAPRGFQPLEPRPPAEIFFPPSFKGPRRWGSLFWFMLRQMGDEFRFRLKTLRKRKAPIYPSGKCKILTIKLPPEMTPLIYKRSRQKRVTVNNLFNAAMLMAVQKHLYDGQALPLRHFNFSDLRPYLSPPPEPHHLGCYFSMMRLTVPMRKKTGQIDIWELTQEINDLFYSALKGADKFCAHLMSEAVTKMMMKANSSRMSAAALSFTGSAQFDTHYGPTEVRDIHAFVSNGVLGPEYTASARKFNRHFYWDILYLDSDMGPEKAAAIAEEIRSILAAVTAE